ncbi:MAG: class I SAM-dependent methyltransferase [Proteobacteria bacterium]|nr:class I SAM-dependent methyltransferase [Pseudomonadota bacterium]
MAVVNHMFLEANHDENARDAFVLNLKWHINLGLGPGLKKVYAQKAKPAFKKETGRDFKNRHELRKHMLDEDYFQSWASMWRTAQHLMWESAETKIDRQYDELVDKTTVTGKKRGTLKTNPKLEVPRYVAAVDIHEQPGGYGFDAGDGDITAGAFYDAAGGIYGRGQGLAMTDSPATALINFVKARYPDLKPKRILEEGCSVGGSTAAWVDAFPDAEIHAIDVSAGMIRMAHAKMERLGKKVHFSQQNAEHTEFPDNHFDLIVSNIMLHETSGKALPHIMNDCYRILKPGGVVAHMDVPLRNRDLDIYTQWYRDWSTHFNNEPFWGALHDLDIKKPILAAGFKKEEAFDEFIPNTAGNGGVWWAAGGRKV